MARVDLHLSKLDGFEVIEFSRKLPRPVPAIMLVGRWTADERSRAAALGLLQIHEKPVKMQELAADIDAIERSRSGGGLDVKM